MSDDTNTPDEPTEVEDAPQAPQTDAVVIVKHTDPDGTIRTEVSHVGGILPTEVQTILELGIKRWRQQIGL